MGKGAKKTKGAIGDETTQRGQKCSPRIDHWVNLSSLILWLVSFLQILICYDNRWRLLLNQFICKIFTLDCLCARLQCGIFQSRGAVAKMAQLRLRSSSIHEHGSSSGALRFMSVVPALELSFFMAQHPAPASVRFHTLMLIVLVFLRLNEKWIKSSAQNQENVPNIWVT